MKTPTKFALCLALLAGSFAAPAQTDFPTKTVHFVFPSTAGGVGANVMHVLAEKLSDMWGQPMLVEPRPGANTEMGTEYVARARPDGYTLLLASSQHVILHHSMRNLPYDAIKDFTPVSAVAKMQYFLAINPRLPVENLQEFIALAKQKPGVITFGSGGAGGPAHLAAEQFDAMTGVKMMHIPYNNKGAAAVLADLMGGHIDVYFTPPGISGFVKSGTIKALAVSGDHRAPALPQVPTFAEAGLAQFDVTVWYGVLAPAGTPKPVVDKIAADFQTVLALPEVREKMAALELEPYYLGPEQFGALMKSDEQRYTSLIESAKLDLAN